ncbi:MAG: plasmid pRiA4b ORF-3 family protein [Phycisphaerae bacterium]
MPSRKVPKLRLVATDTQPSKAKKPAKAPKTAAPTLVLKVTLRGSKPPIWRRVAVASNKTLAHLHDVIQAAFGWYNCHLHQFTTRNGLRFAPPSEFGDDFDTDGDTRKVALETIVEELSGGVVYEYDFGDGWEHLIKLEKVLEPDAAKPPPMCLAGARRCPPEDCGGIWGYMNLLDTLANPKHPDHDDMIEWIGGPIDPQEFDLDKSNKAVRKLR